MANKKWLTFGSLMATSLPLITLVSCGQTSESTAEQRRLWARATSDQGIKILESKWQDKLLARFWDQATIDTNLTKAAKEFIKYNLQSDKDYLLNIGKSLIATGKTELDGVENKFASPWLQANGILQSYPFGQIDIDTDLTNDGLTFLLGSGADIVNVKFEAKKLMIANYYLATVNKSTWMSAFDKSNDDLSILERQIDDESFVLTKEAIDKKYFASWQVNLDETKSSAYTGGAELTLDQALNNLTINGAANELGFIAKNTKYQNGLFDHEILANATTPTNINYDSFLNYQGINTIESRGSSNLTMTLEMMKTFDGTNGDIVKNWEGFVQDDELIKEDIELTSKPQNQDPYQVKLEYIKGFMPTFNATNSRFEFTSDQKVDVIQLLALKDESLYTQAKQFFTTKINWDDTHDDDPEIKDAVILEIIDDDLRDFYENNESAKTFTVARDPKDN